MIPMPGVPVQPYVLGGVGFARVTKKVVFAVGGTDVTSTLTQFGVVLGSDLSGEFTKPMLTVGGGVAWARSARAAGAVCCCMPCWRWMPIPTRAWGWWPAMSGPGPAV